MSSASTMSQESRPASGISGARKSLPVFGVLVFVAFSIYTSQARPTNSIPAANVNVVATDDAASAQTAKAVAAANAFLETLDARKRTVALLDFDSRKRSGWSNLPVTMVPRNGVRLGDLTKPQHDAALAVLASLLSKEGFDKIINIMDGDQMLASGKGGGKGPKGKIGKGKGKGPKAMFGNDKYFLAIFGKPSPTQPWLVQFGGHHLGLNVTIVGKSLVLTPTHTGTQPAVFTRNGKTIRPLGAENDKAFKLINALDEKQQAQAILGQRPRNLILGPGQDGKTIQPAGIKGSALTGAQQAMLLDVVAAWVNILSDDAAKGRMAEIKTKLADTYFAWSGPTTNGSAVYYRVQGPTLVIEYAPQGSTEHIHTIIRDPGNDYGQRLTTR